MDTPRDNLSTRYQPEGGARHPSDTLDRDPSETTTPSDWQPGEDEGKARPSAEGEQA